MLRWHLVLLWTVVYLAPGWGQTEEQKKATVAYLRNCQQKDGGFLPSLAPAAGKAAPRSSLRATSAALRALKYFGGEPRDREGSGQFVEHCFDKASGGFVDNPGGQPDVAVTAIGIMAVAEVKLPVKDYSPAVIKYLDGHVKTFEDIRIAAAGLETIGALSSNAGAWLNQIARMRNPDGTYGAGDGKARDTGGAVVAVLRLGGKPEHLVRVLEVLKAGQRADGGFGKEQAKTSDLETTYRVMRAFHMLKEKPDVERCRAFVATCRNADGGYGVAPGQSSQVGSTYFASIILHWLAEK
jgi:prenyltransferase beta subunit